MFQGYVTVGSVPSHAGYVSLLVQQSGILAERVDELAAPAILVKLIHWNHFEQHVASVHLEPFCTRLVCTRSNAVGA